MSTNYKSCQLGEALTLRYQGIYRGDKEKLIFWELCSGERRLQVESSFGKGNMDSTRTHCLWLLVAVKSEMDEGKGSELMDLSLGYPERDEMYVAG